MLQLGLFRGVSSLGICLAALLLATCCLQSVIGAAVKITTQAVPASHNATLAESSANQTAINKTKTLFWRHSHLKNVIYEHRQLDKLQYTFESTSYEQPVVGGEMGNLSFKHLGPVLHNETSQGSWIAVLFHIPKWPLTPLMLPRVNHVARKYPNMTFLSVDCTNVSSYTLLSWDLSALPSFVLFNSRYNLAQRMGTATTTTLSKFINQITEIPPTAVEKAVDFDDVSLRTEDLPRIDSLLVEILFLIIWLLYSIMRNE